MCSIRSRGDDEDRQLGQHFRSITLFANTSALSKVHSFDPGFHGIGVYAHGTPAGGMWPKMRLGVDGALQGPVDQVTVDSSSYNRVDFDCVAGNRCMNCDPARPITVVQFRGTNDSAVPYGSERSGARANFAHWGEINMCTGQPGALPENSSCQAHSMCAGGVETILCSVQNGSHCGSYMSFGIASLAWGIISQYSLP